MTNCTNEPYPWFPLKVAALQFQFSRASLSFAQRGMAFQLLCLLWRLGGTVSDDKALPRMLETAPRTWQRNRDSVLACFDVRDGVIRHDMVTQQLGRIADMRMSQSEKAKRRWDKSRSNDRQMTVKSHPQSLESSHSQHAVAMPTKPKQVYRESASLARSPNGELRAALEPTPTGGANGNGSDGLAKGASANFDVETVLAAMKQALKPVPRRDTDRRAELKQRANDAAVHQDDTFSERLRDELDSKGMRESAARLAATVNAKRRC